MFARHTIVLLAFAALVAARRTYDANKMLCLVNAERVKHNLPPLGMHPALDHLAQEHSQDQARRRTMTHDSSSGLSLGARCTKAGFDSWKTVGENVAFGYEDEQTCMSKWMASEGHRKNILSPNYAFMGSAAAYDGDTPYYTQDFGGDGRQHDFPVCPQGGAGGDRDDAPRYTSGPGGMAGRRPPVMENYVDESRDVAADGPSYGDNPPYLDESHAPDHDAAYAGDALDYEDEICDADYEGADNAHDDAYGAPPSYEGGDAYGDVEGSHGDRPGRPGYSPAGGDYPAGGNDYSDVDGSSRGRPSRGGNDYPAGGDDYSDVDGSSRGRPGRPSQGGDYPTGGDDYPAGSDYPAGGDNYSDVDGSSRGRPGRPAYGGDNYSDVDGSSRGRHGRGGDYPAGGGDYPADGDDYPAGGDYPAGDDYPGSRRPHGRRPHGRQDTIEEEEVIEQSDRRPHGRRPHGRQDTIEEEEVIEQHDRPAYGAPSRRPHGRQDTVEEVEVIQQNNRPGRSAYGAPTPRPILRGDNGPMMPRGRHAPGAPIHEAEQEEEMSFEEAAATGAPVDDAVVHAASAPVDPVAGEEASLDAAPSDIEEH